MAPAGWHLSPYMQHEDMHQMVLYAADENLNRESTTNAANHTHHSVFWALHCVMGIPDTKWQMANVILHAKMKL